MMPLARSSLATTTSLLVIRIRRIYADFRPQSDILKEQLFFLLAGDKRGSTAFNRAQEKESGGQGGEGV